jgi:endonuclease/exonuclease/phosphatase family metal-dependent hydrolase
LIHKALQILYILILLWLAACILSMNVSPQEFWPLGFLSFTSPVPLLLNALFVGYWLARRSWLTLLPLLVIGLAWSYYARGLALNRDSRSAGEGIPQVQVLSFNTSFFIKDLKDGNPGQQSSQKMIDWIAQQPADIILLQEYHNDPGSSIFNTAHTIGSDQGKEAFVSGVRKNPGGPENGLAIFSRFPILAKGQIPFGKLTFNHGMFADIKIGPDTLRVYNVHLKSMSINEEGVAAVVRGKQVRSEGRDIYYRLRNGFLARSEQLDTLLSHIATSPYPVLIGGDFNDLPWSYTYEQFNRRFKNAFQERGTGVGSTYNGKIPFLRIDNQFYSKGLEAHRITVHREMPYSDHFPVSVEYSIQ